MTEENETPIEEISEEFPESEESLPVDEDGLPINPVVYNATAIPLRFGVGGPIVGDCALTMDAYGNIMIEGVVMDTTYLPQITEVSVEGLSVVAGETIPPEEENDPMPEEEDPEPIPEPEEMPTFIPDVDPFPPAEEEE